MSLAKKFYQLESEEQTEVLELAANTLSALFPKTDSEPKYSEGFERYQKLSRKNKVALQVKFNGQPFKAITDALLTHTAKELLV